MNYVNDAIRTEAPITEELISRVSSPINLRLLHAAMGLCTEGGEFMDAMKREIFYGKLADPVNLIEELGDVCWYLAIAMDTLNVSFDEVLRRNIAKLRQRFPDKFDSHKAVDRNLFKERKVLEDADSGDY